MDSLDIYYCFNVLLPLIRALRVLVAPEAYLPRNPRVSIRRECPLWVYPNMRRRRTDVGCSFVFLPFFYYLLEEPFSALRLQMRTFT